MSALSPPVAASSGAVPRRLAKRTCLPQQASDPPRIMGVLNITPDSFSDGGELNSVDAAMRRAEALITDGAHILDIGGESTRPGAHRVSSAVQMRRILPVIEAVVAQQWPVVLSVDTCSSVVAAAALDRGVHIVNDIFGLRDARMMELVARSGCYAIVMHMRGAPHTMQQLQHRSYVHVVQEVIDELALRLAQAHRSGVGPHQLWVDPGLGFAKSGIHSWQLTKHLDALAVLGRPIVYGASRKSFLSTAVDGSPAERDAATAAVCAAAVASGAQVIRVHNVRAVKDAIAVGWALRQTV